MVCEGFEMTVRDVDGHGRINGGRKRVSSGLGALNVVEKGGDKGV